MNTDSKWKLVAHSHQIADTGDYDGCYEITDGKVSIFTKDDNEDILQPIVDALNEADCKFYLDDSTEFELHLAKLEIEQLKNQSQGQPHTDSNSAKNVHYKWSKIIASKHYGGKKAKFSPVELQELLDDIYSINQHIKQLQNDYMAVQNELNVAQMKREQPEVEKLISDYKFLLANFTTCPQIIIDNPSFVRGRKPTEKDMEWAREKIKEYEANLQSQEQPHTDTESEDELWGEALNNKLVICDYIDRVIGELKTRFIIKRR